MLLNKGLRQCQPQPGTTFTPRDQGIENSVLDGVRNTRSIVDNMQFQCQAITLLTESNLTRDSAPETDLRIARRNALGEGLGGFVGDVSIHEVCERVRSLILAEFPKGLRFNRDYDTSIPEFRGDREQLIQAVLNIAHNAAQALAERIAMGDAQIIFKTRIARQVTFGKQRYRLALELHVIDNGPGVPDSIKDRIFFPLISGREGGSGLGLTLAQTFVQQHHGLIECDSVPGRTDFKLLIPLP